jgi:MFS family permease
VGGRARAQSRQFRALCLARLANQIGAFSLTFLTLLLVERGHMTAPAAGLVMAAFSAATFPSRLLGGWLADRWTRTLTIVAGLGATAAAQLALFAFAAPGALVAAAVGLGLAFEIYEPASDALVVDSTTPESRSRAYSVLGVCIQAGELAAGALAALLAGFGVRWLFLVDAASCLAGAGIVAAFARGDRTGSPRDPEPSRRRVLDARLLKLTLLASVFATCVMALFSILPLTMVRRGVPAGGVGVVLVASSLLSIVLVPLSLRVRALQDRGDVAALSGAYVVMAAGFALIGVARTLPAFVLAATVCTLGDVLALGRARAIVSAALAPARIAAGLAVYGLSWSAGGILAPVAGTLLLAHAGPAWTWGGFGLAFLALALLTPAAARASDHGTRP